MKIVMDTKDLRAMLKFRKQYDYCQVFDSGDNTDGEGIWHCDVEISNRPLGDYDWGDGEERWSFDSLENHITKFGKRQAEVHNALLDMVRTSLSSSSAPAPAEPKHLQEHLELCQDMFDDFYNKAQQFIDKVEDNEDEQD